MPGDMRPGDSGAGSATTLPIFDGLAGWAEDDLDAALDAYLRNPPGLLLPGAEGVIDGREFFETRFTPGPPVPGWFTGYYEPVLPAALTRSDTFATPIHAMPDHGMTQSRRDADAALEGHEIAWLRDPIDRFFLQVQGSGRLSLRDGRQIRLGYAGSNGHPYRSIGRMLIERGELGADLDAGALKEWLRADHERGVNAMNENPSYVFFRITDCAPQDGPTGTLTTVSAGRSIAVDPSHTPLGTPVWIETDGLARLCIAQDTGSAIRGAGRADVFFGTGDAAGKTAGRLNHPGRFAPLIPA